MFSRIYKFFYILKSFFVDRKIISFHCVILTLVVFFTIQYFSSFKELVKENTLANHYTLYLKNFNNITDSQIRQTNNITDVDYAEIFWSKQLIDTEKASPANNMTDTEVTYFFKGYIKKIPQTVFDMDISLDDFNKSDDLIIAPARYLIYHNKSIGDKINLFNREFTVVGSFDNSYYTNFVIPINFALKNIEIKEFTFQIPTTITEEAFYNLADELNHIFNTLITMPDYDLQISQDSVQFMGGAILTFAFGAVCISFFYQYILRIRKRNLSIFILLGMKAKKTLAFIIAELFLIFTFSFIVGFAISNIICLIFNTASLNINEFLTFYLLYFSLYIIIVVFFSVGFLRKMAIRNYSESGFI